MIDGIKRIAEGVIESGKQCSVYTGEITSITPLIIKISDELSLSTQLVVTGRVQTMLNDGDLIVGNSVALLRYQGGQNFLVMDEMDATTPDDWDSMAVINLQNHMEDLIKHITPAERLLWNQNADNVPLQNHISDNVRHIFDWERTAWNEAVSNIPLNNHIADNVKHVTGDERTAWAKNVVDLDTHIGDQIKHITEDERTAWNVHKNNVIIHVTNADKIKWNDHVADEVIHITDGERTGWNSKTDDTTANGHINDLTPHVTEDDKTRLGNTVLSTVQTLTTGQKTQARTNIDAMGLSGNESINGNKDFRGYTTGAYVNPQYSVIKDRFPTNESMLEMSTGVIRNGEFNSDLVITNYRRVNYIVGDDAFRGCSNLQLFNFSRTKIVMALAFYDCPKLKIDVNFTGFKLHSRAFEKSGIKSIDCTMNFPIEDRTFDQCANLVMVVLRDGMYELKNISAFTSTPIANGTGYIYVPDALYDAYLIATNWSVYASQIKKISELNE